MNEHKIVQMNIKIVQMKKTNSSNEIVQMNKKIVQMRKKIFQIKMTKNIVMNKKQFLIR